MHDIIELLVTLGFLGALMWGMMKFLLKEIRQDLGSLRKSMEEIKQEQSRSSQRIDHLYQICIDLLKDRK